jgi:general secretion pathway protein J
MSAARLQRGFTVLELMISVAIVAVMMMISWSVTSQVINDKKFVAGVNDRNHELQVAMTRMVQDISMAYLSGNEPPGALEPRTFFIGKGQSEALLRFSSLGHRVMWADANESEQTIISYYTDNDPYDRRLKNLYRGEARRISAEGWDQAPAEVDLLVRDVQAVKFEYWSWQDEDWKSEWDSNSDSSRNRVPTRVKIEVTVEGRDGEPHKHITQARVMMEERLVFLAN